VILLVAATERELGPHEGLVCGVGPVEAAAATARALAERRPDSLLHVGVAGGRGLPELALVLGDEAVWEDPEAPFVPSRARPDAALFERLHAAFPDALVRAIGTSARVGGTAGCDVEAMEGFAVLRAAELAGVPAVEVRVVANEIDEPDRARWRLEDAFGRLHELVPALLGAVGDTR
jgi:nucleoside phosphorylase